MLTRGMLVEHVSIPFSLIEQELPEALRKIDWDEALSVGPFTWGDTSVVLVDNIEFCEWMEDEATEHWEDAEEIGDEEVGKFFEDLRKFLVQYGAYVDVAN